MAKLPPHITVEIIKHKHQRYDTAGDYQKLSQHAWLVSISRTKDWRHSALVLIHELIEIFLCLHHGITWEIIDDWDIVQHPDSDDPGALPGCPYRKEHMAAERLERLLALLLGVKWAEYMAGLGKLKYPKKRR